MFSVAVLKTTCTTTGIVVGPPTLATRPIMSLWVTCCSRPTRFWRKFGYCSSSLLCTIIAPHWRRRGGGGVFLALTLLLAGIFRFSFGAVLALVLCLSLIENELFCSLIKHRKAHAASEINSVSDKRLTKRSRFKT